MLITVVLLILINLTIQKELQEEVNTLSANPTTWSNTLKQFVGKLPANYLNVFDYFVKLALKRLNKSQ